MYSYNKGNKINKTLNNHNKNNTMKSVINKVIVKVSLDTVNRGKKLFLISKNDKGYFANEVGELTEISKVTGGDQRYCHRLNPSRKHGNQYGKFWRPKPFVTITEAMNKIQNHAQTNVRYF